MTETVSFIPVATPQPEPVAVKVNGSSNGYQTATVVTSQSNNQGGSLNQLKELMDIYKEELLSKEEFEAAKAKLLGM